MRSPNDVDESASRFAYPEHLLDSDIVFQEEGFKDDLNENFCRRIMRKCCALFFCKKKRETPNIDSVNEAYSATLEHPRTFSFAEYELRKFALNTSKEEAVQTGESLEMQVENYKTGKKEIKSRNIEEDSLTKQKNNVKRDHGKPTEQLKLIKFSKETRTSQTDAAPVDESLGRMSRRHALIVDDETEKEIRSTVYERESDSKILAKEMRVKCEVHTEKPRKQIEAAKCLRFDEELTMIPAVGSGGEITVSTLGSRRSVVLGQGGQDLDIITQVESEASESRDFMRFWGISKSKKGKKKKEKRLPRFN